MTLRDIFIHLMQPGISHRLPQGGLLPSTVRYPPRFITSHPVVHPVLEPSKSTAHTGGVTTHVSDPNRRTACTNPLKTPPWRPYIHPLPSKDYQHQCSLLPDLLQVIHNFWPVIICGNYSEENSIKGCHSGNRSEIWPEGPLCVRPGLLCHQHAPIPLSPLEKLIGVGMAAV